MTHETCTCADSRTLRCLHRHALTEGVSVNRVVARFVDGRLVKGATIDFSPGKQAFHLMLHAASPGAERVRIDTKNLKALFFVRDFAGNPQHDKQCAFSSSRRSIGRKIKVEFEDGEVLVGTTMGYRPGRGGFFLEPADPSSNNERCYIVESATREVSLVEEAALANYGAVSAVPGYA